MSYLIRRDNREAQTWDPFRVVDAWLRWDPYRANDVSARPFDVNFDVKENKDRYVFTADLPGVKDSDLDISVTGNILTISGKREDQRREDGEQYHRSERTYGQFTRSFVLPEGSDPASIQADLKDGVLTLNLGKKAEVQPRKIVVGKGNANENAAKA